MPTFEFDADKHVYTVGGKVIPSVTSVLPYCYGASAELARQRGVYVHRTIELYNKEDLDEENLSIGLKPYLAAYKKFLIEYKLEGIVDIKSGSPHPCTDLQLVGYRMLFDEGICISANTEIKLPAFELKMYHPVYRYAGTIDIVAPGHQLQALYLHNNGTYRLEDHTKDYRRNKSIFLSFLISYQWKLEKGLI